MDPRNKMLSNYKGNCLLWDFEKKIIQKINMIRHKMHIKIRKINSISPLIIIFLIIEI